MRDETRQLAPTARFALGVLGRVGDATAEVLEEAGPEFIPGDQLGIPGLQRTYHEELAGQTRSRRGGARFRRDAPGSRTDRATGRLPIQVTLDTAIQTAADAAVASRSELSHIVAIRPGSGEILVVSSNAAANPNNALVGQYPAGCSFKIVSGGPPLSNGVVALDSPGPCPGTVTVGGKEFDNEDQFDLGRPF